MFSRSIRPLRIAAAAGVMAVLAAGCSTAQKADTTTAGGTEHATLTALQAVHLAAQHAGAATTFSGTFTAELTGSTAVQMSGSMQGQTKPSLLADLDISSMAAAGQSIPGGMQEIITGKAIYMKMQELSQMVGKPWMELTFSSLSKATGGLNLGQIIQQAENSSPLEQTQMLAGAKNVKVVGHGTLDGVAVTEYSGTYTAGDAIKALPADQQSKVTKLLQTAGVQDVDFKVWLDSSQQVRKEVIDEHGSLENENMTLLVSSINQPVSIPVPPASQTASVPLSKLGSGL